MSRAALRVEIISSISEIGEKDWDSCACPRLRPAARLIPLPPTGFLKPSKTVDQSALALGGSRII